MIFTVCMTFEAAKSLLRMTLNSLTGLRKCKAYPKIFTLVPWSCFLLSKGENFFVNYFGI